MSTASLRRVSEVLHSAPVLLQGLSWSGLALVFAFCALCAVEVAMMPGSGATRGDLAEQAIAALARIPVFLVTGVAALITAIIVLNAAGRAGRERIGLAVLAAIAGCVVASVTRYLVGATPASEGAPFMLRVFMTWLVPAAALTAGCVLYLRARAAREETNEAALRHAALEKQRSESRLRLLQAQIEPHFLFNTLSNIRRLCQNDAAGGRAMLAQLSRYLRAALPKIRENDTTLGDEIELVSAYLGVQKIRMGERLQVAIGVPPELLKASVPTMMLATLVENAIKHGIAPLTEGGSIEVTASRSGDSLRLAVADTGRGFDAISGSGVGLANIRARLAAAYGAAAILRLEANTPRGVVATLVLPCSRGEARQ
ncbi:MAG: sensor histidine kinase [Burkholderiales bacterium]